MSKKPMKPVSLDDLATMKDRTRKDAPEGDSLGADFWATAKVVTPPEKKSIHLRVDDDVLAFFKKNGKGHLTRMNLVLRQYMQAQQKPAPSTNADRAPRE